MLLVVAVTVPSQLAAHNGLVPVAMTVSALSLTITTLNESMQKLASVTVISLIPEQSKVAEVLVCEFGQVKLYPAVPPLMVAVACPVQLLQLEGCNALNVAAKGAGSSMTKEMVSSHDPSETVTM